MIEYYRDVIQGGDEWMALRRGLLTASEMKLIITPTLKAADNDKERAHVYEIAAQRITGYTEPHYIGDDMLRGKEDEIEARLLYDAHIATVQDVGFITNSEWGFTIGYSPDGVIGEDGLIECKSRRQKYQLQTLVECVAAQIIPAEFVIQIQTGLLVTKRKWCDLVTYCGGMYMATIRAYPDKMIQDAIVSAAAAFEAKVQEKVEKHRALVEESLFNLIPTERRIEQDIIC